MRDRKDGAVFYTNRVLKEFKDKYVTKLEKTKRNKKFLVAPLRSFVSTRDRVNLLTFVRFQLSSPVFVYILCPLGFHRLFFVCTRSSSYSSVVPIVYIRSCLVAFVCIYLFPFLLFTFRDPKHAEWAHTFIAALIELQNYCKEFHPIGVSWASE